MCQAAGEHFALRVNVLEVGKVCSRVKLERLSVSLTRTTGSEHLDNSSLCGLFPVCSDLKDPSMVGQRKEQCWTGHQESGPRFTETCGEQMLQEIQQTSYRCYTNCWRSSLQFVVYWAAKGGPACWRGTVQDFDLFRGEWRLHLTSLGWKPIFARAAPPTQCPRSLLMRNTECFAAVNKCTWPRGLASKICTPQLYVELLRGEKSE